MAGVLHLMCGKIAAGKSTLAAKLAEAPTPSCSARTICCAAGTHEYAASNAEHDLFTSYFVEPGEAEGFNLVVHDQRRVAPAQG